MILYHKKRESTKRRLASLNGSTAHGYVQEVALGPADPATQQSQYRRAVLCEQVHISIQ